MVKIEGERSSEDELHKEHKELHMEHKKLHKELMEASRAVRREHLWSAQSNNLQLFLKNYMLKMARN